MYENVRKKMDIENLIVGALCYLRLNFLVGFRVDGGIVIVGNAVTTYSGLFKDENSLLNASI